MDYIHHYTSPLGGITAASDGQVLTGLWFDGQKHFAKGLSSLREEARLPVFALTDRWLDEYFNGKEPRSAPPLYIHASPFRRAVWEVLLTIPYGHTATYGEVAAAVAERTGLARVSPRAVGGAVGHNPVSLIIPCHRVVGSRGALTGYAGGLERKRRLLALEGVVL